MTVMQTVDPSLSFSLSLSLSLSLSPSLSLSLSFSLSLSLSLSVVSIIPTALGFSAIWGNAAQVQSSAVCQHSGCRKVYPILSEICLILSMMAV